MLARHNAMFSGTLFAAGAGLLWGLVFIAPTLLAQYPALLLSVGRYLAFGLVALPLALADRGRLAELGRADWIEAFKLAAVGNLLYYLCLSAAIQRAGGPLPTMIIGTLPVVIAVVAKLGGHGGQGVPWRRMLPSLGLIGAGLVFVHRAETATAVAEPTDFLWGVVLAIAAVACWTWYPLRNAAWLRAHADRSPRAWATAQGLATLPLAALGYAMLWAWSALFGLGEGAGGGALDMPFGPTPWRFIAMMFALGLLASWLGTLCWNEASQRLPPHLSGQLIVFETLAALAYAFVLRGQMPGPLVLAGAALLVAGVGVALRRAPAEAPLA